MSRAQLWFAALLLIFLQLNLSDGSTIQDMKDRIAELTGFASASETDLAGQCQLKFGLQGIAAARKSIVELTCSSIGEHAANGRCYKARNRNGNSVAQVCELFNVTLAPRHYRTTGFTNAKCKFNEAHACVSTLFGMALTSNTVDPGGQLEVSHRPLILVDRDGSTNLFHTMWDYAEVFRTLVLINQLDGEVDILLVDNDINHQTAGPYGDIWSTMSNHPVLYWKNAPTQTKLYRHVVLPTTGGCSLGWANLGEAGVCGQSDFLRYFAEHTVRKLKLSDVHPPSDHISVLYISRQKNNEPHVQPRVGRKIKNEKEMLDALQCDPSVKVTSVDFVGKSLQEQVRLVRSAHILLGMHGAGMTHLIFMNDQAVIIELFPMRWKADHFHTLAQFTGKTYLTWTNEETSKHIPDYGIEAGAGDKQATTIVELSGAKSVRPIFDSAIRIARSFGPHIDSRQLNCKPEQ